jgi:hypothetical protein
MEYDVGALADEHLLVRLWVTAHNHVSLVIERPPLKLADSRQEVGSRSDTEEDWSPGILARAVCVLALEGMGVAKL